MGKHAEPRQRRADHLRVVTAREATLVSLAELARRTGLQARTIRHFLRGGCPRTHTLDRLAEHFSADHYLTHSNDAGSSGGQARQRWLPSAAAERLGRVAIELEAMVYRDGYRIHEAGEILRTSGRTALSDLELARLLEHMPPLWVRPRRVDGQPAEFGVLDPSRADASLAAAAIEGRRREVLSALARALEQLDPQDRQVVKMRYSDGSSLGDISRALRLEQRPLYRRLERLLRDLRVRVEVEGVSDADVRELLADDG